ncbi:hypothetical protein V490_03225 [Pseudogymnoascus sp. VKM F-3557]|nr:hypothetical protein V490_03225 [Pseudogymnoascus sp. VKM F-3557]
MDPLSVTASIIAVVQLTSVVIGCLNSLKDTSKDRSQCVIELANIRNLLVQLTYRLDEASSDDVWHSEVRALATTNGPLDQFRSALEQLQSKLTSSASSRTKIGSALSWKFSKEEVTSILTRIERLKSLTQIALEMDQFKLSQALKGETAVIASTVKSIQTDTTALIVGVNSIEEGQSSDQYRTIMKWLSPTDFPAQQSDIIGKRQQGTGEWFVKSPEFTSFLRGEKQTLFCPGIPGAGKTMISAIAVNHIWEAFQGDNVGVAYIYNNYNRQEEQTTEKLVAAILKQLVQGRLSYGEPVLALHKQHASRGSRPSFDEICTTIHSVLNNYSRAYIIIDALDECTDTDGTRGKLISALLHLQTKTDIRLMVTSRFGSGAEDLFQGALELEIQANEADVKQYVAGRLGRLAKCVRNDKELQVEIQDGIVQAVDHMFLLAPLHLDSLEDKSTKKAIRLGLKNLPRGLMAVNETYNQAINRIERQSPAKTERAKTVISWISYAERQLTTTELCYALAVEADESELDEDNIPDIEELTSVCAGLVAVDKESGIIRLVHYTTQEYFKGIRESWNPEAQDEIASTCLTYLSFEIFNAGHCDNEADFESRMEQNPFLDYASKYWGNHASTVQQAIKGLALPFLRNTNQLLCSTQVIFAPDYKVYRNHKGYSQSVEKCFTGIHVAAYFGLEYLLQELTHTDENKNYLHIDARDSKGWTPLSWAAMKGHTTTVKWLIEQDNVVADSKDNGGQTPLSHAAAGGHEAIVKLLVGRHDVAADSKDEIGDTPLSHAAAGGHEAIVRLLVGRHDVTADSKNIYSQTLLSHAAAGGHEAIVKLLIKRDDVVADSKDDISETPLLHAARRGHEAIVNLLVKRDDVVADSKDNYNRTPLSWAAKNGHEAIVKLLVERDDVVADSKDNDNRTPLSWAARCGREAIVKLLVERDDVVADSRDYYGRTPLSGAAMSGHKAIVKLLLERGDVEADSKDTYGQTPLSWAAEDGHEEIMRLLVERDDVVADLKDNYGQTPLLVAARHGRTACVKVLLGRHDVVADSKENSGMTPLMFAARHGYDATVKLLIERNDVVADSKDNEGRTPLSWAVGIWNEVVRHEAVVKLLIERNDVMADSKDNEGRTPLSWAVESRYKEVVKLLLEHGDVVADSRDNYGRTPLSWAAQNGNVANVQLLLESNDVDPSSEDNDGHTPLWWATEGNYGKEWWTPYRREEVENGREAIAKLITDRLAKTKETS